MRSALRWLAAGAGVAAGAYATYTAAAWARYGHAAPPPEWDRHSLLDRFMPEYEAVERHHIRVQAPAAVTLAAAGELKLFELPLVRFIFKGRELILGATSDDRVRPRALLAEVQSLGWVVLAARPDREVAVGAVTRPWEPNVTFRGIPPEEFQSFAEPGYVKIVWNLRADPDGPDASIFRTETRAIATDAEARVRFRRYWAFLSPGIMLIRWLSLGPVKRAAEAAVRDQEGVGTGE